MLKYCLLILSINLAAITAVSAQTSDWDTFTIATYYPSPYGMYHEMRTDQQSIGTSYRNTTVPADSLIVAGRIGIGTATPGTTLDVNGPIWAKNSSGHCILSEISTGGTYTTPGHSAIRGKYNYASGIGAGVAGITSSTAMAGSWGVYGNAANATHYAGYFAGGKNYFENSVGIGTTTPLSYAALDVITTGNKSIYTMDATNGGLLIGYQGSTIQARTPAHANSQNLILQNWGGNVCIGPIGTTSYLLQIAADSAAKPSTNVWSVSSDKRIKKNIADFIDGLNIIMKLRPRTYQYNGLGGKGYDDTNTHIGFVAQEIEPIAPYLIETNKGTIGGAQVNDFKSYQGHALPFILVNAIQEQQNIIKTQQLEIEELKARLDNLEEKQVQAAK